MNTTLADSCPYYLGEEICDRFPQYVAQVDHDQLFLITSTRLLRNLGTAFSTALNTAGIKHTIILIEEGEHNKSWSTLADLGERLIASGATHDSVLVSLGGGLVSNLVGLTAGLLYRGVRYIDVPTTLLAQTDGTLSNKQAINGRAGKNQFGLYHAPLFIWSDVAYVRSEPIRQIRSALVESVKNGLVNDEQWLSRLAARLSGGITAALDDLVELALDMIRSKLAILHQDPTERKSAVILEYGHTCGHAVEWLSHGALCHGEAVGIGICFAGELGYDMGITPAEVVDCQRHLIGELLGSPLQIPADLAPEALYRTMLADNKRRGGNAVRFLLLDGLGQPHNPNGDYLVPLPPDDVLRVLRRVQQT